MKKVSFVVSMLAVTAAFVSCSKYDDTELLERIRQLESTVEQFQRFECGHEFVDLGLSVKWATMNVGADSISGYGDYVAWGATEPLYKPGYAQSESPSWKISGGYNYVNTPYQTANTTSYSSTKWTKYLGSTTSSYQDASASVYDALKTTLDMADDAARINWGGRWRIPAIEEIEEMCDTDNCTWTWYSKDNTEFGGVAGYKVTSKVTGYEGNWIFLPAAGYRSGTGLSSVGSNGEYWSGSLDTGGPSGPLFAKGFHFYSDLYGKSSSYRYYGRSVRPVFK